MNGEQRTKQNAFPLVSVCIGTFNREKHIRETLDSVFAQTYPNLEVIVVDDASTDGTIRIIKEYGDRIILSVRESNSGMCPITRNQAAKAATGKYLAFLDSDDKWYPDKITKQVAIMESREDVMLCHTYCHLIDEESKVIGVRHEGKMPTDAKMFQSLFIHCWITISSSIVRRSVFEDIGWFDEDPRCGIWGEDIDFFLRVTAYYKTCFIPEVLTCYRKYNANTSGGNWKKIPESIDYYEILIKEKKSIWEHAVSKSYLKKCYIINCITNSVYWRDHGFPLRSLYFCLNGIRMNHSSIALYREVIKSAGSYLLRRREMKHRQEQV